MSKLKGKQIQDNSLDLNKLRSGSKILPNTSTLGADKMANEILDPQEFTTKNYVDKAISLIQNVWLEQTGFGMSGTSGIVTYTGTFIYPFTALTDADIFINGIKLRKKQYYFDIPDNYKPTTTSILYFNLAYLPITIDVYDYVEIKYLYVGNNFDENENPNDHFIYNLPFSFGGSFNENNNFEYILPISL